MTKHFHLSNHDYMRYMVCFIIMKDIEPLEKRLSCESFITNFFKKLDVKLINEKIPKLFAYNMKRF